MVRKAKVLVVGIAVALVVSSGSALAQGSDPIRSGLQQGASLSFSNGRTSTTVAPGNGTLVALGDSVAAGLGLPSSGGDARCGRSNQAYGAQVAASMNLQFVHAACSGATVGDLVTRQGVNGPNIPAQLDTAFRNGTPSVITITAGANDLQWLLFIRKCVATDCGTAADTTAANALRTAMELKLTYALESIQTRSMGNPPRVIITGYYNPISNYCKGRQSQVANAEIDWLNQQRDQLNVSIRNSISAYPFVKYASTNFTDHSICATVPWTQGLNDPAPLHPNAAGQQVIAKSVLNALR
jgi:lysophospholipase L1-like esterase